LWSLFDTGGLLAFCKRIFYFAAKTGSFGSSDWPK